MANSLSITTSLVNDHYVISGTMVVGTLPAEVFMYENPGDGTLGNFVGVCSLNELTRLQVYVPNTPIPIFGNKYIRTNTVKIVVELTDSTTTIISNLVNSVQLLSTAYQALTSQTQVYNIV